MNVRIAFVGTLRKLTTNTQIFNEREDDDKK